MKSDRMQRIRDTAAVTVTTVPSNKRCREVKITDVWYIDTSKPQMSKALSSD